MDYKKQLYDVDFEPVNDQVKDFAHNHDSHVKMAEASKNDAEKLAGLGKAFQEFYTKAINPLREALKNYNKDDPKSVLAAWNVLASYDEMKRSLDQYSKAEFGKYKSLLNTGKKTEKLLKYMKNTAKNLLNLDTPESVMHLAWGGYMQGYEKEGKGKSEEDKMYYKMRKVAKKFVKI